MANYQIRKARPSDMDAIINLCEDHATYEGADYDRKGKADRLSGYLFNENSCISCLVVIAANEEVKGYATFMPEFSTWDASYYLHMDCLYLEPEVRGMGVGKEIMKLIYEEAKSSAFANVQWQTPTDNINAIEFYKKIGATPREKVRFYLNL